MGVFVSVQQFLRTDLKDADLTKGGPETLQGNFSAGTSGPISVDKTAPATIFIAQLVLKVG